MRKSGEQRGENDFQVKSSQFNLIDLAGDENSTKSSTAAVFETISIGHIGIVCLCEVNPFKVQHKQSSKVMNKVGNSNRDNNNYYYHFHGLLVDFTHSTRLTTRLVFNVNVC